MATPEQILRVIVDRKVAKQRAKEAIVCLWNMLAIECEEVLKAQVLLDSCVRFDLEDDADIAALRERTATMLRGFESMQAEMAEVIRYENSRPALPEEAYALVSMPPRATWIAAYLAETKQASVLDLAPGNAQISVQLLYYLALVGAPIPRWVASGYESKVLRHGEDFCRRRSVPIEFAPCAALYYTDAPGGPFDVVLLLEVLEHVRHPLTLLHEARRRGRKVVVTVPGADTLDGRAARIASTEPRPHVRQFTPRSLAALLGISESEVATISNSPADIGVVYAAIIDGVA